MPKTKSNNKKREKREAENSGREKILAVAEQLFIKMGYEATSVEDILRRAKISKGGFYHHFASKGEVFRAVVNGHLELMRQEMIKIIANKNLTAEQKLAAHILNIIEIDHSHNHLLSYIFSSDDLALVSEEYFNRSRDLIFPLFLKIIEQGIKEKTFKVDRPKETLELLILMRQASTRFLPEILKDKKKFVGYFKAMNGITEKTLGLRRGFFKEIVLQYLNNKHIKRSIII